MESDYMMDFWFIQQQYIPSCIESYDAATGNDEWTGYGRKRFGYISAS
jgi:hypothetical protein